MCPCLSIGAYRLQNLFRLISKLEAPAKGTKRMKNVGASQTIAHKDKRKASILVTPLPPTFARAIVHLLRFA